MTGMRTLLTGPNPLPRPKLWRVAFGFVAAPLVPAALWMLPELWNGAPLASYGSFVMLVAIYGAYPATILLGVPAYFVLRRRMRPLLVSLLLAGGLIAAAPWPALMLLLPNPQDAWIGGCHTVVDGKTTWCGYWEGVKFIGWIFALGATGGVAFWICVVWRDPKLGSNRTGR